MPDSASRRGGGVPGGSRIHRGLVGERALVGTPYLADPTLRAEYEREIAPRTGAALSRVLAEIFPQPHGRQRPRRVVDLGAGTGAAGQAIRRYFGGDVDVVSIDRLGLLPGVIAGDVTDRATLAALATQASGPFDLAVAAHVLNEMFIEEEAGVRVRRLGALVKSWCELLLGETGTLILLEPALRETSRALLGVRDHIVAAGYHVVAPCFFTGPCPALVRERDWCHDAAPAPAPAMARVDFSYLVLRPLGEPASDSTLFRVVSDPLPEKGRLRLFACGASGRHALVRLDRQASPANADFERLTRGDIARVARTAFAQDGLRVVDGTTVERQS